MDLLRNFGKRVSGTRSEGSNETDDLVEILHGGQQGGQEGRTSYFLKNPEEDWVKNLPKVELHVHFPGSFDLEVIWDRKKDHIKYGTLPEFVEACTCKNKRSLAAMLETFKIFQPLVKQDYALAKELAYRFVLKQHDQNILYTEIRYSPHLISDIDPRRAFAAVTEGLRQGCEEVEVDVNQILCCIDDHPEWSSELVDIANENRTNWPCAVVGVDVAAGEEYFKNENSDIRTKHDIAIKKAREDYELNVTIHAGEDGGMENVEYAIYSLEAQRIGHGYALAKMLKKKNGLSKNKLHKTILERNIHFEVCLSSSFETGGWKGEEGDKQKWNFHPVLKFKEAGYSFSLSTDDPTVFRTDLNREIRIAMSSVGLKKDDIVTCMHEAIKSSWATEEQSEKFLNALAASMETEDDDML